MFALYGLLGLSLVIVSYTLSYFFANPAYHHLNLPFEIGYWLFFDAVEFSLTKTSLVHTFRKYPRYFFYFIGVGALLGLFFDFFGVYISKVWIYPVVNDFWTALLLYIDWGIFLLMIYSSYRVFLYFIKQEFHQKKMPSLLHKDKEKLIFPIIGFMGLLAIIISLILFLFSSNLHQMPFALAVLGLWFICEFVEFKRLKKSLIKDTIEGDWRPILAILIGSTVMALAWETMNLPLQAWVYINVPFSDITVWGVPLFIILGWPALFIVYLSFYRAFFKGRKLIWK